MVQIGNFSFADGSFDDWQYEVHWLENKKCKECDCYCTDLQGVKCVPKLLHITVINLLGCEGIDGTYEMYQCKVDTLEKIGLPVTNYTWPTKQQWLSQAIPCPHGSVSNSMAFLLECASSLYDEDLSFPIFRLTLVRFGTVSDSAYQCSRIGFDPDNPSTLGPANPLDDPPSSFALNLPASTCEPFYLLFPFIVEGAYECSEEASTACCGGYVESSDPPSNSSDVSFEVIITE